MPIKPPPQDLRPYFLTLDDVDGEINFRELFGNDRPIEIDVGCGRGLFLVTAGEAHPDRNYLGIEVDFREARRTAKRLVRRELDNARVLGADVRRTFDHFITPGSVSAVHVYFPDPWWKRKHKKRCVFTDRFVDQLDSVLQPSGLVHSWTDVEEYFQVIHGLMTHDTRFVTLPAPTQRDATHDQDYHTSFERKARKSGGTVHRGLWQKISATN